MRVKNSLADDMGAGCAFGSIVLFAVGAAGWCLNIYKLALAMNDPVSGLMVMRAIGILFWPMGMVLGYV